MNVRLLVKSIIEDVLMTEVVLDDITVASDIEGWDSIAHLSIIIGIEKQFKIKFTHHEIEKINCFEDLYKTVESKL